MKSPNVLLIILDAVRARNTSVYGYHRETTPFLESYADRASVYTQARSPGIHSVASHASMWSGYEVEEHGVVRHQDTLSPEETIWYELGELGYETGLFTRNAVVAHSSNLAEPFDRTCTGSYVDTKEKVFSEAFAPRDITASEGVRRNIRRIVGDEHPFKALFNSTHHVLRSVRKDLVEDSTSSHELIDEFVDWQADCSEPWAGCINLIDAHFPYAPDDPHDLWGGDGLTAIQSEVETTNAEAFIGGRPWWKLEVLEHLYDGAIRQADHAVSTLVERLQSAGVHDETLVIVTSDHGEGFGEVSPLNGRTRLVDHNWGIHEVLTHVPLIVSAPHQTQGEIIDDLTSLVNLRSTIEEVVDENDSDGRVRNEGPVFTSTTRLHESDSSIFEDSENAVEDYIGPWRAVYEEVDGTIRKYCQHRGDSRIIEVYDAQQSRVLDADCEDVVEEAFDGLSPRDIKEDPKEMSDRVEQQLTDLGYM